jgi:hypothetical protein
MQKLTSCAHPQPHITLRTPAAFASTDLERPIYRIGQPERAFCGGLLPISNWGCTVLFKQHLQWPPRRVIVVGVATLAIFLCAVGAAVAGSRYYWWQANLGGGASVSDGVFHNHYYNEIYFGPGATYPSGVFERTQDGTKHYSQNSNGNIFYSHSNQYYDDPWCWNRDSSSHFVTDCGAAW